MIINFLCMLAAQWALMVFHSKLWELSLMACYARWTFNVNAS